MTTFLTEPGLLTIAIPIIVALIALSLKVAGKTKVPNWVIVTTALTGPIALLVSAAIPQSPIGFAVLVFVGLFLNALILRIRRGQHSR